MIKLLNNSQKKYEFRLTNNPITNVLQSPRPTGKSVDEAKNEAERKLILEHRNYSESEVVYCKPGLNTYENDEHAEYIYRELGAPEDGGVIPVGQGHTRNIKNRNFVLEVDEKGEEIKNNLYLKYRVQQGVMVNTNNVDPELFVLKPLKA